MTEKPEIVILAGGKGTRLQGLFPGIPKCMVPVNGRPFLEYVLDYLAKQKFNKAILSVGYLKELIINHFKYKFNSIVIEYCLEETPLGTGGAVAKASKNIRSGAFFVINGDTLFKIDFEFMWNLFQKKNADVVIAVCKVEDAMRYGSVRTGEDMRITGFSEKSSGSSGLINGGVYLFRKALFDDKQLPAAFSLEKDFLENRLDRLKVYACISDGYFIDIGIPADYSRAEHELKQFRI